MNKIPDWQYTGRDRPPFADSPGPDQESVWDYPRPPIMAPDARRIVVQFGDFEVARTTGSVRILETASPPTFYLPLQDINLEYLEIIAGSSWCEWKGSARYWRLNLSNAVTDVVAWDYPQPNPEFAKIKDYLSFYPGRLECFVGSEKVRPQDGGFYGGWVTNEVVGPIKGQSGTESW